MNTDDSEAPVCLVTGGGGVHVGWGICLALAQHGYHVVAADSSAESAEEAVARLAELGFSASAAVFDVSDQSAVRSSVDQVFAEHGRIDGLVNSAGIGLRRPLMNVSGDDFDRLMHVNVLGALSCVQAVAPHMARDGGGSIVNIGSIHGSAAAEGYGLYSAAKSALVAMTRAFAVELGTKGIRCNVVHPGAVRREADLDPLTGDEEVWARHAAFALARQALHRPVRPVDLGNAVAFLISDAARGITGTELTVDGGTTALLHDLDDAAATRPNSPKELP